MGESGCDLIDISSQGNGAEKFSGDTGAVLRRSGYLVQLAFNGIQVVSAYKTVREGKNMGGQVSSDYKDRVKTVTNKLKAKLANTLNPSNTIKSIRESVDNWMATHAEHMNNEDTEKHLYPLLRDQYSQYYVSVSVHNGDAVNQDWRYGEDHCRWVGKGGGNYQYQLWNKYKKHTDIVFVPKHAVPMNPVANIPIFFGAVGLP